MRTSETFNELAAALAKAQGAIENAEKDRENVFLKNRYMTLTAVWDAIRKPLSDNGLSIVQVTEADDGALMLLTRLMHSSGQYIEATYPVLGMDAKGVNAAQAAGSALTYARRYSLTSMIGVVAGEDDDAASATGKQQAKAQVKPASQSRPSAGPTWTPEPATAPTDASNGNGANPLPFRMTKQGAVEWAMTTAPQVWPVDKDGIIVKKVVEQSFDNLTKFEDIHGEALGRAWVAKVAGKLDDRAKAAIITDAELDGTDLALVVAGEGDEPPLF